MPQNSNELLIFKSNSFVSYLLELFQDLKKSIDLSLPLDNGGTLYRFELADVVVTEKDIEEIIFEIEEAQKIFADVEGTEDFQLQMEHILFLLDQ